ncbi:thermonuclease family protein [Nitrospira sp. KM1]|uniref:thermonuclease family protein n=1 Tax=Nitrospira sp. KM1 TaxID=1936990 RepID=UPI001E5B98BF|nr:thermonuclease family protein [Nitrospira sp. KM1]
MMHVLFVLGVLQTAAVHADFSGEVVGVLEGDLIEVRHRQQAERIRLNGIDCPEKGQPFGTGAKQAVIALVFGKKVTLKIHGLDKYGRTIADVILPEGTNVSRQLVKDGWCWWYRKYAPHDSILETLEREAKNAKMGLWADAAPIPPWDFRRNRRGQAPEWIEMDSAPVEVMP